MPCINYNGKLLPYNSPIIETANRGLRYGDGVFETMKWYSDRIVLSDDHFERLFKGLQILKFNIPEKFSPNFFTEEVKRLVQNEELNKARIRLTVIRGNGNTSDFQINEPSYIIEASDLNSQVPPSIERGLNLCIYREARKMADILSPLKHNNFLPYCLASMYAKEYGYDDAILLNQFDRICDTTIANIFLVNDSTITTPLLSEGCIAGVIRKNLLRVLSKLGFTVREIEIDENLLTRAEAAFVTNSIINMRPVASIGTESFILEPVFQIKELIERKTELFC